ncbi:hypothetical protein Mal4_02400 [Maioricimonas rarisocia]|uniref:N-acetyltransferase domain-containing protein n=1 Tax=Maioricimonas rarisocia TaxID=2528026 RepID=A0A517Z0E8_9PLAN|nr:GNAT family N-acetyltransferase [Maioricimonas rarisocia]QDU35957.1 hypothetical protein Mal4_02400 [Maioricimonas rarisocia]
MTIAIREIDPHNDDELHAVASLRFQVTVDEMRLSMRHANHHRRTVIEPLDHCGHILAAWAGERVVGTVRINRLSEGDVGEYVRAYGLQYFLDRHPSEQVSITTRLAIHRKYRRGRLSLELPMAAYAFYLQNGIEVDVIDSRRNLRSYFHKLGYREHLGSWRHPEFGDVVVQYMRVRDEEHLSFVKSPFLPQLCDVQRRARSPQLS